MEHNEFIIFLIAAKKNTYAGSADVAESSRPNSKDLYFQRNKYLYIDSYVGSFNFIGEEVVWVDNSPIWGMNYYGDMLIDEIPEGFIDCLKGALREVPYEKPFRGPDCFAHKDFKYYCSCEGDINKFKGMEWIDQNGERIYELMFHGGNIK